MHAIEDSSSIIFHFHISWTLITSVAFIGRDTIMWIARYLHCSFFVQLHFLCLQWTHLFFFFEDFGFIYKFVFVIRCKIFHFSLVDNFFFLLRFFLSTFIKSFTLLLAAHVVAGQLRTYYVYGSLLQVDTTMHSKKERKKTTNRRTLEILYSLRCIRISLFRTKREHFLCGFNHLLHSSKLLNHVMIILLRATKIFFFLFLSVSFSTLCVCLLFFVSTFYIIFWTVSMFTRLILLMMKRKRIRGWWW